MKKSLFLVSKHRIQTHFGLHLEGNIALLHKDIMHVVIKFIFTSLLMVLVVVSHRKSNMCAWEYACLCSTTCHFKLSPASPPSGQREKLHQYRNH